MAGGQAYSGGGSGNPYGSEWEDYGDYDWYDENFTDEYDDFYSDTNFGYEELPLYETDEYYYLPLTDEDYELITDFLLWAYIDDGEGYVELGADAWYQFDEDGDLIVSYDYTWLSLDGLVVPYYSIEDTDEHNYGYVPCEINGEDAEIILLWTVDNPEWVVAGWRYDTYGEATMKGLFELEDGLEIDFYYYYYTYDGDVEMYYMYDTVVVDGEPEVYYTYITDLVDEDDDIEIYYEIIDIYQNSYYTESLYF
jgi:hypothetical protein